MSLHSGGVKELPEFRLCVPCLYPERQIHWSGWHSWRWEGTRSTVLQVQEVFTVWATIYDGGSFWEQL